MASILQIADVLIASWTLAQGKKTPLPTQQGILDRALKTVIERGNFPPAFRETLHFVDTRVGLRCAELGAILSWAQAEEQTSDPNPSYDRTLPKVSPNAALTPLYDLGIDEEEAMRWGNALVRAVEEEQAQQV